LKAGYLPDTEKVEAREEEACVRYCERKRGLTQKFREVFGVPADPLVRGFFFTDLFPAERSHLLTVVTNLNDFLGEFRAKRARGILKTDSGSEEIHTTILSAVGNARFHFEKLLFDRDREFKARSFSQERRPKEGKAPARNILAFRIARIGPRDFPQPDGCLNRVSVKFSLIGRHGSKYS